MFKYLSLFFLFFLVSCFCFHFSFHCFSLTEIKTHQILGQNKEIQSFSKTTTFRKEFCKAIFKRAHQHLPYIALPLSSLSLYYINFWSLKLRRDSKIEGPHQLQHPFWLEKEKKKKLWVEEKIETKSRSM